MDLSVNPADLLLLANAHGISTEDAQSFLNFDAATAKRTNIEDWVPKFFADNKEAFDSKIKQYNQLNPSAKILSTKDKIIKKGLLVLAVVVMAAAAYFAYKKFKK